MTCTEEELLASEEWGKELQTDTVQTDKLQTDKESLKEYVRLFGYSAASGITLKGQY